MLETVKTVINSPCGVNFSSRKVDLCKIARANLPIIDELIGLARYIAFAAAISPCVAGACNREAIEGWFTDYLTDSEKGMAKQLQDFIRPWKQRFSNIESSFDQVGNDIGQMKDQFGTVEQSIEDVVRSFCSNITACAETAVSKLQSKEITSAADDTEELVTVVTDAIHDFDTLGNLDIATIVDKVMKEFSSIKKLVDLLQAAKKLPNIIDSPSQIVPKV
ncbi:hypothetical protein EYC80_010707 [Monilinia laxa]|uniref:Uncharacterized protein n=1 Tax=Monilinia laxa TaxID=61186 RepID=A0A5N6JQ74_MONLA|nr:hypothetical protein EYC80_010707 [Monilinia laxa]